MEHSPKKPAPKVLTPALSKSVAEFLNRPRGSEHAWEVVHGQVLTNFTTWLCRGCGTYIESDDHRDWAERVAREAGVLPACDEQRVRAILDE